MDNISTSWRTPSCAAPPSFRRDDQEKQHQEEGEEEWKDERNGSGGGSGAAAINELQEIVDRLEEGFDTDALSVSGKARQNRMVFPWAPEKSVVFAVQ